MNFDWIVAPVTQEIILGVGLLGSLALWIGARSQVNAMSRELKALRVSTEATLKDLSALSAQMEKMKEEPVCEVAPAPSAFMGVQGLNLTTRTKVLRMHRRGEATSSIAAALGVHQEEVDLLLKVDRMLEAPKA